MARKGGKNVYKKGWVAKYSYENNASLVRTLFCLWFNMVPIFTDIEGITKMTLTNRNGIENMNISVIHIHSIYLYNI